MNGVITHSRDIICWFSNRRMIYSIPLYFKNEKDYFRSSFLEVEISPTAPKNFILQHGDLKSYIIHPGVMPLTNQEKYSVDPGCCEKK